MKYAPDDRRAMVTLSTVELKEMTTIQYVNDIELKLDDRVNFA